MGDLRRALLSFGKAYAVTVIVLVVLAFVVARVASRDPVTLLQLLLVLMGVGYVFAAILAWTGFANIYRYSPTLFIGSRSYRRSIVRGDMAEEGRGSEALAVGVLFGLALLGLGIALTGWIFAAGTLLGASAALAYLRFLVTRQTKSV